MSKAAKKNPSLEAFNILIGDWATTGKHPLVPGVTLQGKTTFEWLENGAFVIMQSHIDHKDFPDGIAIFGSDDGQEEYMMNYFDERTVSRKYICTIKNNIWKWWRDDKKFSQRFIGEIESDGNTIIAKGEMSIDGKPWEKDLELVYKRMRK